MSHVTHHIIAVTSFQKPLARRARRTAKKLFPQVTPLYLSPVNTYYTFFILPDGSKESWEESKRGDKSRNEFLSWCKRQAHEDGSNSLEFTEVAYGDFEG